MFSNFFKLPVQTLLEILRDITINPPIYVVTQSQNLNPGDPQAGLVPT
jgi:hypothetical protein